ncbi:hypothetical protein CC80DRAFT_530924 [Byssothecium circinans]|uniref:Uncharacterized protein n=1 Tax=Byssothecium circinans TaxID=147558 RepID=A0A6A5UED2_9PLEO|nr:hypothetical protein CC80DRAFT_530924 [Byssothecium circinans]
MLNTKWETGLPDTGYDIVSPLVNEKGVYAGSHGYVLRINPKDGSVSAKNSLSGMGEHEVRLASPVDASVLIVGTNGYVLGLDPDSLYTQWSTSLPDSGYELVSVLCGVNGVYAGSNGYVYRLDPDNGTVKARNNLPGYGKDETRLGLTISDSCLLVGINGYAFGLDPSTLVTRWTTSLPGCGEDITSVVGGVGLGFSACAGYLYMLNASTGKEITKDGLKDTGKHEVRLALDKINSRLYAGTNGYGICFNTTYLTKLYSTSLPGSGYTITDVAVGDGGVAYFANNGYVFQLDSSGNVTAQNNLPEREKYETRLATYCTGAAELIVGINGYSLGLNISDSPKPLDFSGTTYPVTWMPYILDILKWRTYNPSEIDGVGMLLGYYRGKIIGDEMKTKTCTVLRPNSDGNSYTWVYKPNGAIVYKWWDHDDRANYTRHSQLGSGDPVICAGEFRVDANYAIQSVIAMANDASGHYKPDGGACLQYVAQKLEDLGIGTKNTQWYWN